MMRAVRMTVAVLGFALALSVAAAEPREKWGTGTPASPDGRDRQECLSSTVRLIVRFREPAMTMTAGAIASRRSALAARVADLRRDLDRFEKGRVVANEDAPRITRTFHRVLFGASVRVRRELHDSIAALPYVATVEEERTLQPLLYESVPHIRADKVWQTKGTRGAGVVVAVIDSGIDYNHIALGEGFGTDHKVIGGWDFVDEDADPMDTFGHGTYVAGIIAGNGDGLYGVAPEASLLAYRALAGSAGGYESDVIAAVERTVDPNQDGDPSDHADIANMSLGGVATENDAVAEAVENATRAGVLFCIAAGNGGDYGDIPSPAIAPSAISVGASDDNDAIADFSSRGPSWDFSIKPEISAPGVKIGSTWLNNDYRELQGTSAAAPHVAGVAALLKSIHRDWTPAELKSAIVSTSVILDDSVMIAGAGRVDALNAANTTTLVSPALVSFGQDDPRIDVWTSTRTVTLRNLSSSANELTANVRGLREGVDVHVTPSTVTLAPGASADVTIDVAVANAKVPTPLEGTLSFGGQIEWSGGDVAVHVPWAFVKGAFLKIDVSDEINPVGVSVLSKTKKWNSGGFFGSTRFFWAYEPVDLVLTQYPSTATGWIMKTVFAEEVDPVTSPHVTMPLASAQHTISTETLDLGGQPLTAPEGDCIESFVFAFPNGRKVSFSQIPKTRQRYSDLSQRVKVYPLHRCADVANTTTYNAMHPPFNGLTKDVTSTLQPQWLRQDVKWLGHEGGDDELTENVSLLRFPGPEETYYLDGGAFFLMHHTSPQLTMYYNAPPSPEADLVSIVERYGHFGMVYLYMNGTDVRVENDVFLDVSPMAYRVPAGSPLVLGTAPVWPLVGFFRSSEYWGGLTIWNGALGERRDEDLKQAVTIVRDESGAIIGDSSKGQIGGQQFLPLGAYTIESTNDGYDVAGAHAKATVNASLDLRRSDAFYPLFTGLRIVDGSGRQASVIDRGANASLLFSVADIDGHSVTRYPPREEGTRVEYRLTGTSEWRPLSAVIEARQYQNNSFLFGGVGTMWRADLSSITQDYTGFVDLRIHAEDHAGNDVQLRLEPAFFVGKDMRRRAARH